MHSSMQDSPEATSNHDQNKHLNSEKEDVSTVTETHADETEKTTQLPEQDQLERKLVEEREYITGIKLFTLVGSLTIVTLLVLLDMSIIGTAIPRITTEFKSLDDVGWYLGAYLLASATLQPMTGKIFSHFNIKTTYLFFFFFFELGSLVCGVAQSSVGFIIGRAIAGIGASGLVNGSLTILTNAVPLHKSPMYTGVVLGISQTGIVMGPLVSGALTEHSSWRWCFYMNLPIGGAAALCLLFIRIPEVTKKPTFSLTTLRKVFPELDPIGFVIFAPASIMLLLALQYGSGNSYPWNSSVVIGLFVGAGVGALIFIAWEYRMKERAMLPGSLISQRVFWTSGLVSSCVASAMLMVSNWIPTYFQAVKNDGPTMSGVHVLPAILSQLLCIILSGASVTRIGYYLPFALAGSIITAVGNGLLSTFTASTTVATWVGYQIIVGAGRGIVMQMPLIAVQNCIQPAQTPVALALLIFLQNLGPSIFLVISNVVFAQTLTKTIPQYAPSVSPEEALAAGSGAQAVRNLVAGHEQELAGVLRAYSESLRNVFLHATALAGVAALASLGMGWKDISKNKKAEKKDTQDA